MWDFPFVVSHHSKKKKSGRCLNILIFFFFFDCQIRGAQPIKKRTGLVLLLKANTGMNKRKKICTMVAVSGTNKMGRGSLRKVEGWAQDPKPPAGR